MPPEPRDPTYEARVRSSFERQKVMSTIGATLTGVEPGSIRISLPYREDLTQQHGYLHAGIVTTVMDSACGFAALSLMAPEAAVLAIELKANFIAPAAGESIVVTGTVLKSGRTITVCTAQAHAVSDGRQTLVATMLATMMAVTGRGITD